VGIPMLLFYTALIAIPDDLTEAARVDGATSWGIFWRIKFPLLLPTIGIVSVLTEVGLPASPLAESPYTTQIKEFYHTLNSGSPVRVSAADGLAVLQIAAKALESARTGQPVSLEQLPEVSL
ncbi:MAG: ABC transporter permease subunit, partial [Chloroflexales bacterium]|nr:ABC transporter permease subunit [Chloroflexales bacterium]